MRTAAVKKSLIGKDVDLWENFASSRRSIVESDTYYHGTPVILAFGDSFHWTLFTTTQVASLIGDQFFCVDLDQLDGNIVLGNMSFPPKNEEKKKASGLLHVPTLTYLWTPEGGQAFDMLSFLRIFPLKPPQCLRPDSC